VGVVSRTSGSVPRNTTARRSQVSSGEARSAAAKTALRSGRSSGIAHRRRDHVRGHEPAEGRPCRPRPVPGRGRRSSRVRPIPEPAETDGDVFELRIASVTKRLGNATARMLTYNGSISPALLSLRSGEQRHRQAGEQVERGQFGLAHRLARTGNAEPGVVRVLERLGRRAACLLASSSTCLAAGKLRAPAGAGGENARPPLRLRRFVCHDRVRPVGDAYLVSGSACARRACRATAGSERAVRLRLR
jgi:hypothetical protein